MKTSDVTQAEIFVAPTFNTLSSLINISGQNHIIVIGCGRSKKESVAQARALYVSKRFQTSRSIAENLSARYLILSACHGIVAPETELEPYDLDIRELTEESRLAWVKAALDHLYQTSYGDPIILLADGAYAELLLNCNSRRPLPMHISAPLVDVLPEHHQEWLDQALQMSIRIRDLRKLYMIINQARELGRTFKLGDLCKQKLPKRGVYIFLDISELNFMGCPPRIVRIGTHAVSTESKSTLRNRLKNHMGRADGTGNHRGSVFRLHVGRAMLNADNIVHLSSWGLGQYTPSTIRASEEQHERRVSEYLRGLEVFVIPIDDEPSKCSLRTYVETQLIALCTEGLQTIDKPSLEWLGTQSPMTKIVQSGLWNIRDVGKKYKPDELGSIEHILTFKGLFNNG